MKAPIKKPTPAEWLCLIAEKAKGLREAGVTRLQLEGCDVAFAPYHPPGPSSSNGEEVDPKDPLEDPDTYGGWVPRMRRRDEDGS
jgi:hypothetical protein